MFKDNLFSLRLGFDQSSLVSEKESFMGEITMWNLTQSMRHPHVNATSHSVIGLSTLLTGLVVDIGKFLPP